MAQKDVETWVTDHPATAWHIPPEEFQKRLKELVDSPYKLAQGGYPWCTYAAVLMCLLKHKPWDVVHYADKLYAEGKRGLICNSGTVSDDLKDFDVAKYARRELDKKPPHGKRPFVQPVDFVLLAGLCSSQMDGFFSGKFNGTIDDRDASPPMDDPPESIQKMMMASGAYTRVNIRELKPTDSDADIKNAIAPSANQDVLLVAPMAYFWRGLGLDVNVNRVSGRHVVPVVMNTGETLTIWSWGDEILPSRSSAGGDVDPPKMVPVVGGYEMPITVSELKGVNVTRRYVITGVLK